ncbi:MAG TPA: hypothetical protein VJ984_02970 [Xanthomonadales bacterium]|nr:hypothetical protein [Xanthomonadales bacterium]
MKPTILISTLAAMLASSAFAAEWPMGNDPGFSTKVKNPTYDKSTGPFMLVDAAHNNFHVTEGFIDPFVDLAENDGYQVVIGTSELTSDFLRSFQIVMIITALPFEFTTKNEVTTETTFTADEINALHDWVTAGGSLLVFSEHAPFDQAINPLLNKFGITSSVGTIADPENHDKELGRDGWVIFSRENGLLNTSHPLANGRNEDEIINNVVAFGGSSLSGDDYQNIFQLSDNAENRQHATGVGPVGMGNSMALAGTLGEGKVLAFGDSNGFTAMNFDNEDGSEMSLGMNTAHLDWKQMVLNSLHWLSGDL